jgi:phospholipase C
VDQITRRRFLHTAAAGSAALGAAAYLPAGAGALSRRHARALRTPDSLPFPALAAGQPTGAFPFEHIVMVMQEYHSFDNYFGMLPRRGQPLADGFTFNAAGQPVNSNPYGGGIVYVERAPTLCQPTDITQSWDATHDEVNDGAMDGFGIVDQGQMYYYDQPDIPFYYSLANAFCLANRWFCSVQAQTYPNRRFYLAGSAYGAISSDLADVTQSPPNGTLVDRLNQYGITWKDYFVDVPQTSIIFEIPEKNPGNMAPIAEFFADCAAGTLPSVSWVSSEIGALYALGGELPSTIPIGNGVNDYVQAQNQDEENPANIQIGESFVAGIVDAVLKSPAWDKTLLVWLYDEHGGYYDHVPPPAAVAPDNIPPDISSSDYQAGYDVYGVRVPAVVASPYSVAHGVSNTVCDHTSLLATIEAQWNLPALTHRDANANTIASFLQATPTLLEPPTLASPGLLTDSETQCSTADPHLTVHATPVSSVQAFYKGRDPKLQGLIVQLHTTSGSLESVAVELLKGTKVVASATLGTLTSQTAQVVLHEPAHRKGKRVPNGAYTLRVTADGLTWLRQSIRVTG